MSIVTLDMPNWWEGSVLRCAVADRLIVEWKVCKSDNEATRLLGYKDWTDWSQRFDNRLCEQLLGPHGWAIYKALRAKLEEKQ